MSKVTLRALAVLWGVGAAVTPLRAERVELDLFEKISIAPLAVRGQIEIDSQRLADIRVLEVIKGDYPGTHLQIAYRLINFERPYEQEKIEFREGEQALLFLVPLQDSRGLVSRADRFILFKGPDGKVPLPAEGAQVWIDASRRLAALSRLTDGPALFDSLRTLLEDENPLLVQIGLRQAKKHQLVDERMLPAILRLVRQPQSPYRAEALELAAGLLHQPPQEARPLALRDHLLGLASAIADEAGEAALRRAAVRLLASDGTPAARAKLQSIAEIDPSQDVRYEAAVAVYKLRSAASAVITSPAAAGMPSPIAVPAPLGESPGAAAAPARLPRVP